MRLTVPPNVHRCELRLARMKISIYAPYINQDFHFGILSHSSIRPTGLFATAVCTSDASAPSGSQVCAFGMEPTGTLICFPYDFSHTSPSPLLASPGFLLLVADSTPRARAATRSALPWPRRVAVSDGSPPAATSNS